MKTILSRLMVVVLVASTVLSSAHAVMGPQRAAKCIFQPDKWKCSEQDRKTAKKWLIGTSVAAVTAVAAAVGIGVSAAAVKKAKESAAQSEEEQLDLSSDKKGAGALLLEELQAKAY